MKNETQSPAAQALLEHETFVSSVVRGLLPDEASVQDVVQETWMRALHKLPGTVESEGALRAWLARVGSNLALSSRRSETRRKHREADVAHAENDDSWERALQRVEDRQRVAEAILALGEPYRSVVLLRYEEDLSPAQIGEQLGRSAATVRSQLSRAHDHLREKLDEEFGDRRAWAALALPLGGLPKAAAPATTLGSTVAIAVGACVVVAIAWVVWLEFGAQGSGTRPALSGAPKDLVAALAPVQETETSRREVVVPTDEQSVEEAGLPSASAPLTVLPQAELLDRKTHGSYGKATFSFEHGLRDDPGTTITGNDWELLFSDDTFRTCMVTDDKSLIFDLGEVGLTQIDSNSLAGLHGTEDRVRARQGHSYVVWTRDSETDRTSVFEVVDLKAGDRCVLDWYTLNDFSQASGSFEGSSAGLLSVLRGVRELLPERDLLESPSVLLQLRGGAIGGNPCRLHMTGEINAYVRSRSANPLSLEQVTDSHEDFVAHSRAGFIPAGQTFLVKRVSYQGSAFGDSNGKGAFRVQVGSERIVDERGDVGVVQGVWTGELAIESGEELSVFLEISNSSVAQVELDGEFIATPAKVKRKLTLMRGGMALFAQAELRAERGFSFAAGHEVDPYEVGGVRPEVSYLEGALYASDRELFDLGPVSLADLKGMQLGFPALPGKVQPITGHSYFFKTRAGRLSVFQVEALLADGGYLLNWYSQNHIGQATGSHATAESDGLAETLESFANALRRRAEMNSPHIRMQLRVGSVGGNTCEVNMIGKTSRLTSRDEPLDLTTPPVLSSEDLAYCEGGLIPAGKVFVVDRVSYRVDVGRASKRRKHDFRLRLGSETIEDIEDLRGPLSKVWAGRLELRPGDEDDVLIEARYETTIDVEIFGSFIDG